MPECLRCGRPNASVGRPDPCLGELVIVSVCCGHGTEAPHVNLQPVDRDDVFLHCRIERVSLARSGRGLWPQMTFCEWVTA